MVAPRFDMFTCSECLSRTNKYRDSIAWQQVTVLVCKLIRAIMIKASLVFVIRLLFRLVSRYFEQSIGQFHFLDIYIGFYTQNAVMPRGKTQHTVINFSLLWKSKLAIVSSFAARRYRVLCAKANMSLEYLYAIRWISCELSTIRSKLIKASYFVCSWYFSSCHEKLGMITNLSLSLISAVGTVRRRQ